MKIRSQRQRVNRWVSFGLSLFVGWSLCELVLRILIPVPIFYSTWFTEGVHERDAYFGFVFRPNYDGAMRNVDQVWSEPLQLNSKGFRKAAVRERGNTKSQQAGSASRRIVMLGSASMGFGYGLADHETLHHQVADHLKGGCQIDLISWPGFTLGQDVQKLRRMLIPDEYDVGVILAYSKGDYEFSPDWGSIVRPDDLEMQESVVTPDDPASRLGGKLYWDSYVLAGLCRMMYVPLNLVGGDHSTGRSDKASAMSARVGKAQVVMAAERLKSLGIDDVLIVALPQQGGVVGPAVLSELSDTAWIDLRYEPQEHDFDWIAYGHYGPESASHLAKEIAAAVDLLD